MSKILFVCTGNSCRSVMAEWYLKRLLLNEKMTEVHVLSAGTSTFGGFGPTDETIDVMAKEGVNITSHIGQPLTPVLVHHADAIFCMEEAHRQAILSQVPDAMDKVHMLSTFQSDRVDDEPDIPDPIGRPKEVYESCFFMIKGAVKRVFIWVKSTEGEQA